MSRFLFLQDGYNEGFKKGRSDALIEVARNPMSLGSKEGLKYLTGITNREGYFESFNNGYYAGYAQGMIELSNPKKDEEINKPQNNQNMSNTRELKAKNKASYESQIIILEDLSGNITKLIGSLEKVKHQYNKKIEKLDDEGLLAEMTDSLRERALEPTVKKIDQISEHLKEYDLVKIKDIISKIEDAKSKL